ncbi:helix-turn-helix domain-containing protein [Candidatus Dojkabacteria bacterium]|nr:helix-turn-helix domain-containing protein [Candidatus Dojkabacteria bacterium]
MYEYIGDRIRKVREMSGLSQKTLGITLGLSDKAISSYESGRTIPPLETLFKIAKELKKPVSYFIESTEDEASLYDRIDRTERTVKEIAHELDVIKDLLKDIEAKQDKSTPPSRPL